MQSDVFECPDNDTAAKVSLLVRSLGHATTQTWVATPWEIVETMIVNQTHCQTVVASKASRCVLAAEGRPVIDFGLRRVHGYDAGIKAARAGWIAGLSSTTNVFAGQALGIPISGTMAHSFVQAFGDEEAAFRAYAQTHPGRIILLIDTYDTLVGARRAADLGRQLVADGRVLQAVRLDSGDLAELAVAVRRILDVHGAGHVRILASGGLDEDEIARIVGRRAPVDIFAVGTKVGVAADAPCLDMAYKLVEYDGRPVMKLSTGKATWPGPKQVWRRVDAGLATRDVIGLADERGPDAYRPLLELVMRDGRRVGSGEALPASRERARRELASLPSSIRALHDPAPYAVSFSPRLVAVRDRLAQRVGRCDDHPARVTGDGGAGDAVSRSHPRG